MVQPGPLAAAARCRHLAAGVAVGERGAATIHGCGVGARRGGGYRTLGAAWRRDVTAAGGV